MSVLASPLEPLAFDVVSFGLFAFVNNLWTWLALVTAAVSFWRIRAAAESSNAKISTAETVPEEEEEPPASSSSAAAPAASAPVASRSSEEDEGVVTKGLKFTVYYENYEEGDGGELTVTEELEGGGGDAVEVEVMGGEWWERMLKLRNGEMGWYRYQDLTEINGNVVRLWEWDAPCLYKN